MKSVLRVWCGSCSNEFHGYIEGTPMAGIAYVVACPKCNEDYFFSNTAMWLQISAPEGAVKFKVSG